MDTLVLSQNYEPVGRVSWQRAVTLWWIDKVEIVESYDVRLIRGASFTMPMPSVVRFLAGVRPRKRSLRFSRENVYARDRGRCAYCMTAVPRSEATYDHVVPRTRGGRTSWENIVIACRGCNQRKGAKAPEEVGLKLRIRPERPKALPPMVGTFAHDKSSMPASWKPYLFDVD